MTANGFWLHVGVVVLRADIPAVIAGIILGGLAGNALASRTWGRAPYAG